MSIDLYNGKRLSDYILSIEKEGVDYQLSSKYNERTFELWIVYLLSGPSSLNPVCHYIYVTLDKHLFIDNVHFVLISEPM